MCLCGQGTKAGVGVTRPSLWPSCLLLCILELMRAEGGAMGPAGLITGRQRPWGGPDYNRSPDWGQAWRHREAVSISVCPDVLSPVAKLEWRAAERTRQDVPVFSSCSPPSAVSPSSCTAGLGGQGTRQRAGLGAMHSCHTAVLQALLAREHSSNHCSRGGMCDLLAF